MPSPRACAGCQRALADGQPGLISFAHALWHAACLRCARCSLTLAGDEALAQADGRPLCAACLRACQICHLPLTAEEAILAGDDSYHASCFVCRSCHQPIETLVFAKASSGIYCMPCHQQRVASHTRQRAARAHSHSHSQPSQPQQPHEPRPPDGAPAAEPAVLNLAAPSSAHNTAEQPSPQPLAHRPSLSLEARPRPMPLRSARRPSAAGSTSTLPLRQLHAPSAATPLSTHGQPGALTGTERPAQDAPSPSAPMVDQDADGTPLASRARLGSPEATDCRLPSGNDDPPRPVVPATRSTARPRAKKFRLPAGYILEPSSPSSGLFDPSPSDKESTTTSISSGPAGMLSSTSFNLEGRDQTRLQRPDETKPRLPRQKLATAAEPEEGSLDLDPEPSFFSGSDPRSALHDALAAADGGPVTLPPELVVHLLTQLSSPVERDRSSTLSLEEEAVSLRGEVERLRHQCTTEKLQHHVRRERLAAHRTHSETEAHELEERLAHLKSSCVLKASELTELMAREEKGKADPPVELERNLSRRLERISASFRSKLDSLMQQRDALLIELEELAQSKAALMRERDEVSSSVVALQRQRELEQCALDRTKQAWQQMRSLPEPPAEPGYSSTPSPAPSPDSTASDSGKMFRWMKAGKRASAAVPWGIPHSASSTALSSGRASGMHFSRSSTSISMGGLYQLGGSTPNLLVSQPDESTPDLSLGLCASSESSSIALHGGAGAASERPNPSKSVALTTGGHDLHLFTAVRPTRCMVCQRSMWGQSEVRCARCNGAMHQRCGGGNVPPCQAHSKEDSLPGIPSPPSAPTAGGTQNEVGCALGSDLSVQAELEGRLVPQILSKCIEAVEARALRSEGIYRLTGGSGQVALITSLFEQGAAFDLLDAERFNDPDAIGSVLKNFLRALPLPLIPAGVQAQLVPALDGDTSDVKAALKKLPPAHAASLALLVRHLHEVHQHRGENLMTARNLGTVFGPTLFRSSSTAQEFATMGPNARIVEYLILNPHVVDGL